MIAVGRKEIAHFAVLERFAGIDDAQLSVLQIRIDCAFDRQGKGAVVLQDANIVQQRIGLHNSCRARHPHAGQ
ncbi:hypothetical protein D3C72_2005140 [compost metagenome]